MTCRGWFHRIAGALFPWPTRPERRERIEKARAERARSARERAHAERLGRQLEDLVYGRNHIADAIARQVRGGHRK